jgi:hypothetical protein
MNNGENFPRSLLDSLESWMNHDPDSNVRLLKAESLSAELVAHVEPQFKQCEMACFRRVDLPYDSRENPRGLLEPLLDLLHTGKLEESISSWTTNISVAQSHLEGVQGGFTNVIFRHYPLPSEVLVDLGTLFHSQKFQNTLTSAGGNYPAIRSWMAREHEVILHVPCVHPEEVVSLGGFISSPERLQHTAAEMGLNTEAIDALPTLLRLSRHTPGHDWWLSEEVTRNLVTRMQSFAQQRYIR